MKTWVRRQIDQLCQHLDNTLGTAQLSDDIPEPLLFGQTADEGVGTKASRSDHQHALAASLVGAIPTLWWDIKAGTGAAGLASWFKILQETPGNEPTNAPDTTGAAGAFGVDRITMGGIVVGATGHIVMSQGNPGSAPGVTTDRQHSVQRMSRFVMRARVLSTATPAGNRSFFGAFHETVDRDLTTLDDALGFWIQVDAAGVGNFLCYAQSSTTGLTTTVDSGVKWDSNNYMILAITYDLTTASFYINDVLVGQITTNIPTAKVFGWGMTTRKEAGSNFTELMFDDLILLGRF